MQISRLNTLSIPLKSGILAGFTFISASAGTFTIFSYRNEIFRSIEDRYIQTREFTNNKTIPFFKNYFNSLNSIFSKHGEGFGYVFSNGDAINRSLRPKNIMEGYVGLGNRLSSGYFAVNDSLRKLNEDSIRKFIYEMSLVSNNYMSIISILKGFMESYISGSKDTTLPSDMASFLSSAGSLFTANSKIISQLKEDDFQNIINFMSKSPDKFTETIKEKELGEKWGNYSNKTEFLNDILPPNMALEALLKRVSIAFIECGKETTTNNSCGTKYTTLEDLIEFSKLKDNKDFMDGIDDFNENLQSSQ